MKSWLFRFAQRKTRKSKHPAPRPTRLRLEALEGRVVPTAVTYHGGAVLANTQAQAVYLGSAWNNAAGFPAQQSQLEDFLQKTVTGSYLDMLGNAGYTSKSGAPIAHGTFQTGIIDPLSIPVTNLKSNSTYASTVLTDAQIQADLKALITSTPGPVQTPNADALYFVFVQPNVIVDQRSSGLSLNDGSNSTYAFNGYHNSFTLADGTPIRYAVLPYQGSTGFANNTGHVANTQAVFLSSLDSATLVASHEMAEAASDPDGNGWYESVPQLRLNTEIADLDSASTVYLNGYAVQRESAPAGTPYNFMGMTPAGATASHAAGFSLQGGTLYVSTSAGTTAVTNPSAEKGKAITSISSQGIDAFGQPMIDVIFSDGNAYEYHDFPAGSSFAAANPSFFPFTFMTTNARQAVAGQAVSYVVLNNGNLGEFVDPNFSTYRGAYGFGINPTPHGGQVIVSGFSIDAGTDKLGVNVVDYTTSVKGTTTLNEWRDETVTSTVLASGVTAFSAGQGGLHAYVDGDGNAYLFSEVTGSSGAVPADPAAPGPVTSVALGVSATGGYQLVVIYSGGAAHQYDGATNSWTSLATNVSAVSKPVNGMVRVLLTTGEAFESLGGSAFWDSPSGNTAVG